MYKLSEYGEIQKFVNVVVSYPKFTKHTREIHIFNATKRPGIAFRFALFLKSFGFNIPGDGALGNVSRDDPGASVLYYDVSLPADYPTLESLGRLFYGEQLPEQLPVFGEF